MVQARKDAAGGCVRLQARKRVGRQPGRAVLVEEGVQQAVALHPEPERVVVPVGA